MLENAIRTVLFDLDGTLIDHFKAIHRCFDEVLKEFGYPRWEFSELKRRIGPPLPITMAQLTGSRDGAEISKCCERFREIMKATFLDGLEALPGAIWILQELQKQRISSAIFTNKGQSVAGLICEHLGFTPCLSGIFGTAEKIHAPRKPEAEFTQNALKSLQAQASSTILIGDSDIDIESAHIASLRGSYAVATGTHSLAQLRELSHKPTQIFPNLHALGTAVFGFSRPEL